MTPTAVPDVAQIACADGILGGLRPAVLRSVDRGEPRRRELGTEPDSSCTACAAHAVAKFPEAKRRWCTGHRTGGCPTACAADPWHQPGVSGHLSRHADPSGTHAWSGREPAPGKFRAPSPDAPAAVRPGSCGCSRGGLSIVPWPTPGRSRHHRNTCGSCRWPRRGSSRMGRPRH